MPPCAWLLLGEKRRKERGERREKRGERREDSFVIYVFEANICNIMNDFFYKKLIAYQKAKEFTKYVYSFVQKFPSFELYAMSDQLRRAAVSIPSNIAEGMGRMAIKERIRFLEFSYGSLTEVTCQLDIAQSLGYITEEELKIAEDMSVEIGRLMSGLRKSLLDKININPE
jgi:four helix bundle protein